MSKYKGVIIQLTSQAFDSREVYFYLFDKNTFLSYDFGGSSFQLTYLIVNHKDHLNIEDNRTLENEIKYEIK